MGNNLDHRRQFNDFSAVLKTFRGSGKKGAVKRLLQDRRRDTRKEDVQDRKNLQRVSLSEDPGKNVCALLSPEDRKRYRHRRQGRRILGFTIQYETLVDDEWVPVVRYDTSHRIAHKDILDIRGREKKVLLGIADFREALLLADDDIKTNWKR
jgi:hypothetical protein